MTQRRFLLEKERDIADIMREVKLDAVQELKTQAQN
jgi:hypothetical protein